jgi:hypothetical protein
MRLEGGIALPRQFSPGVAWMPHRLWSGEDAAADHAL